MPRFVDGMVRQVGGVYFDRNWIENTPDSRLFAVLRKQKHTRNILHTKGAHIWVLEMPRDREVLRGGANIGGKIICDLFAKCVDSPPGPKLCY